MTVFVVFFLTIPDYFHIYRMLGNVVHMISTSVHKGEEEKRNIILIECKMVFNTLGCHWKYTLKLKMIPPVNLSTCGTLNTATRQEYESNPRRWKVLALI